MKIISTLLIAISMFTACQGTHGSPNHNSSVNKSLPAQKFLNVSYGKDSLQRMDVYLPAHRSVATTKSIILIHGGGWNGGSKESFTGYVDSFKKRLPDYAFFNLNYRLVNGGNLFPTQENDIKQALEFIGSNTAEYGVNKEGFVLLGASAGAHLALLQAYKYNDPKIQAVIDFFGPTDLLSMYQKPWHPLVTYALQLITGATPQSNMGIYKESSPLQYVTSNSTPTLIFHGANDNVVDVSQSELLANKLANKGVKHHLVIYPGVGHGWYGPALTKSFDQIELFLKANVK